MIYLNDKIFEVKKFHGGELTALFTGLLPHNKIRWLWDDTNGAAEFFVIQSLMKSMKNKGKTADLEMPYFPFARNDGMDDLVELTENGAEVYRVDTLGTLTDSIDALGFKGVSVVEPHSAVAPRSLNNCTVTEITPTLVENCLGDLEGRGISRERVVFVFPDAGAEKRYSKKAFYAGKPWIGAVKRRDLKTGELEGYNFFNAVKGLSEYDVAIIVDDICGRGGTFLPLAEAMRKEGFKEVYLVVAHCENNIHNGQILSGELIDKVYTTDSILTVPHTNIVIGHKYRLRKDTAKKLLVVVDMQNDFVRDVLGTDEAQAIIPKVKEKIEVAQQAGYKIIFTRDTHDENYLNTQEGRNLPVPHCIKGTRGWQIIDEFAEYTADALILDKPNFGSVELAKHIIADDYDEIEFCGLCTDICVVSNAIILKAHLPETPIVIDPAACAGVSTASHQAAILTMNMCQIKTIGDTGEKG